ncbi:MAG: hypothetical protein QOI94_94 [Acidobacteriaceae bacterium]|nr:hypothetical protein [Acidobacteriaceae bacterium]
MGTLLDCPGLRHLKKQYEIALGAWSEMGFPSHSTVKETAASRIARLQRAQEFLEIRNAAGQRVTDHKFDLFSVQAGVESRVIAYGLPGKNPTATALRRCTSPLVASSNGFSAVWSSDLPNGRGSAAGADR